MNPNQLTGNKTYYLKQNGTVKIAVPGNPTRGMVLLALIINSKGGSGNTVQIFDTNDTLGENAELKRGVLDTTVNIGRVDYGFPIVNGIWLKVGGGTTPDITVVYADN